MDKENNIFDKDDALDFIMFDEIEKENKRGAAPSGCLGMLAFLFFLPFLALSDLFLFILYIS